MNLVARQIFGNKKGGEPNTFIGGVSASIGTDALLATKLSIDVARISNFTVVGSDIKCRITGSYAIPNGAFSFQSAVSTFYKDSDLLVTSIGDTAFYAMDAVDNLKRTYDFKNATTVASLGLKRANAEYIYLENATSLGNDSLSGNAYLKKTYIPRVTTIGTSPSINNSVLTASGIIYAHPSMATINGGGIEADLAAAIAGGATVRYVTNFTAPNPVTTLATGTIYNTAIQLNFTTPTGSVNAIEYYECWVDGVQKNNITASGEYVLGLTPSTLHSVTLVSVDIFLNKSVVSNSLSVTTNTTSAVPTSGLVSYYKLDETTGTVAYDDFGSDDLTNTSVSINQSGKVGTAYKTTGSTQKLQTTTATAITGNFTLNMWVYVPAVQTLYATPFEVGNHGTNTGFGFLFSSDNRISWRINQNYNNYNQSIFYGVWQMITMVYNGTNVKFYINGNLTSTTAHTANPTTTQLRTAFRRQDSGVQAICSVDEIAIYNTAKTKMEIDLMYNLGNGITL